MMDFPQLSVCLLVVMVALVDGLRFHVPANGKKCLKETVHKDLPVTGEYEAKEAAGQKLDFWVVDTMGNSLVNHQDKVKSKFSFATDISGDFEICFKTYAPQGLIAAEREVYLIMKHGVEAKNYDALAESQKLKPLEVELRRLEDLSESIVNDFAYMRQREEEMRDTNESTNIRVLYLSIFSMCCLLSLATWQVLYLRRYFKAKKLIE